MLRFVNSLIANYASKGVLLDTNVFLLFLVGHYELDFIQNFNRTKEFDKEAFAILDSIVTKFKKIYTTPQVLAELSNFSFKLKEPRLSHYLNTFIRIVKSSNEEYINKDKLITENIFYRCGITDASIFKSVTQKGFLVITTDFKLAGLLKANNLGVLNFNHIIFPLKK